MAALENLERLRQNLETNIEKLRKSLRYWQTWEFEYGGLKEELELLDHEPSAEEMMEIGTGLGLDIVDAKEIKALVNYGKKPSRSRAQVLNTINGRMDTGQKNATSMQKQLTTAEEKLEKVLVVSEPALEDEDGEQLMDIFEELDDDGNIISSSVVNAEREQQELKAMLKGKGVLTEEDKVTEEIVEDDSSNEVSENAPEQPKGIPHQNVVTDQREKVSFTEKPETRRIPAAPATLPPEPNPTAPIHMHPSQRMLVIDDEDNLVDSKPLELIAPPTQDETIDYLREARRNAAEIAPIVATFDIEDDSDSDMDDDSDNDFGMNDIGLELTDDYKTQMEELMRKHARAFENVGPALNQTVVDKMSNVHRDPKLVPDPARADAGVGASRFKPVNGRGVRFAEDLDINHAPNAVKPISNAKAPTSNTDGEMDRNPVSEEVVERPFGSQTTILKATTSNRNPSKFKMDMQAAPKSSVNNDLTTLAAVAPTVPPVISGSDAANLPERPKKVSRFKAAKMEG